MTNAERDPDDELPKLSEMCGAFNEPTGRPESEPAVWAIVSLMGHKTLAGRLTEEEKFGVKLGRLDIPFGDGFRSMYFGGSSVYSVEIVAEEVARDVCKRTQPAPVSPWDYPKALAASIRPRVDEADDIEDDGNDPDEF